MPDQDGKRAQQDALHALESSTPGDRSQAHEDALARYLRLQAQSAKKRKSQKKDD
jgi:hypothetical protein